MTDNQNIILSIIYSQHSFVFMLILDLGPYHGSSPVYTNTDLIDEGCPGVFSLHLENVDTT